MGGDGRWDVEECKDTWEKAKGDVEECKKDTREKAKLIRPVSIAMISLMFRCSHVFNKSN